MTGLKKLKDLVAWYEGYLIDFSVEGKLTEKEEADLDEMNEFLEDASRLLVVSIRNGQAYCDRPDRVLTINFDNIASDVERGAVYTAYVKLSEKDKCEYPELKESWSGPVTNVCNRSIFVKGYELSFNSITACYESEDE